MRTANGRVAVVAVALSVMVGLAASAAAQSPTLADQVFFGGPGSQRGTAVAVEGASVYVVGWNQVSGLDGVLVKYGVPPGMPLWSTSLTGALFNGVTSTPTAVYPVGGATAGTCPPTGSGGTGTVSLLGVYDSNGTLQNCHSPDFFPFDGHESYAAAADSGFVYAGGRAEQNGDSNPFVLVKYDATGALVSEVTEPGIVIGSFGCCFGESGAEAVAISAGDIYVAGFSRLVGFPFLEDNFVRPVLMRYDTNLNRIWKMRPGDVEGTFRGLTGVGSHIYAVGSARSVAGDAEYLVEKYDDLGNRVWSVTSGTAGNEVLTGIVALGTRLFAVGFTSPAGGTGSADAVLLEIDPNTGVTLSTTQFGGAFDDLANGIATDGTDLYVVAESRSFASAEGNLVGDNDLVLLRYTFDTNHAPVANAGPDRTVGVGCSHGCTARVRLDGRGSSDPDGDTLTYTWTGVFGTATGVRPKVKLPIGSHTITLTVNDGHGGTDSDTVTIDVIDTRPPRIKKLKANPRVLWPPDHRMVSVNLTALVKDVCDPSPSCQIVSVKSNEPVSGTGSGDLAPDWQITGPMKVDLRAERSNQGSGRVYTITVQCTDASGNAAKRTVRVRVPKNLGQCDDDDDDHDDDDDDDDHDHDHDDD